MLGKVGCLLTGRKEVYIIAVALWCRGYHRLLPLSAPLLPTSTHKQLALLFRTWNSTLCGLATAVLRLHPAD